MGQFVDQILERQEVLDILVRRLNAPYFGKRYIGSSETKVLHDADRETDKCKIDSIARKHIQMFEWLSIPKELNYAGCQYCMPDYQKQIASL